VRLTHSDQSRGVTKQSPSATIEFDDGSTSSACGSGSRSGGKFYIIFLIRQYINK
jgi:hypothetical protein